MKITVIGSGNAGCFTALHFGFYSRLLPNVSVELIHNPNRPPEKVGQGTLIEPPELLWEAMGLDWYNNPIDATPKLGILYENWGKKRDRVFHPFPLSNTALHYSPEKLQATILKSGYFNVKEEDIIDYKQIDSDYIFDCRGKPDNLKDYIELENPVNAVILAQDSKRDLYQNWTRAVATTDGWCFVIPNTSNTTSYGYLYNHHITSDKKAKENFEQSFDVEATDQFKFKQYVAKNPIIDDRIILNGNKLFFLEPLEATAIGCYLNWIRLTWDWIMEGTKTATEITNDLQGYITEVNNFITWHYQYGSKYNTPFWKAAKKMTFKDSSFDKTLLRAKLYSLPVLLQEGNANEYGQWSSWNFKYWNDGMTKN
mgnify:CR=1 FL=1